MPYLGETMALLTAVLWAIAVIFFKKSGETVHPLALNLFKDVLAAILVIPTIYIFGETLAYRAPAEEYLLLLASGALGIGIADTLFLASLNRLGAGLTAIVDCLYSPFIIGLSMLWLGEVLTVWQFVGVIMIISAILAGSNPKGGHGIERRRLFEGLAFGAMSMAATAVGIVIIKPLLTRSPLLWVTEVRLIGGILVLVAVLAFHPSRRRIIGTIGGIGQWGYTFSGSFFGAYLSMMAWLAGMKFTQASIAAALNQSTNIFIFLFAVWFLKEPMSKNRIIGIILGVAGSILVTFA
jgi:drug/metabolite transporter (DMT)-like permease